MADIAPPAAVNTDIQADTNRLAESPIPSATARKLLCYCFSMGDNSHKTWYNT